MEWIAHLTSCALTHSLPSELIAAGLTQAGGAARLPLLFFIHVTMYPNPDLGIVIASETKQSRLFQ